MEFWHVGVLAPIQLQLPSERGDHVKAHHRILLVEGYEQNSMQNFSLATNLLKYGRYTVKQRDHPLRTLRCWQAVDKENDGVRDALVPQCWADLWAYSVALQAEEGTLPEHDLGDLRRRCSRVRSGILAPVTALIRPFRGRALTAKERACLAACPV